MEGTIQNVDSQLIEVAGLSHINFLMTRGEQALRMGIMVRKRAILAPVRNRVVSVMSSTGLEYIHFQLTGYLVMLEEEEYGESMIGEIVVDGSVCAGEDVLVVNGWEDEVDVVRQGELKIVDGHVVIHGFALLVSNTILVMQGIVMRL